MSKLKVGLIPANLKISLASQNKNIILLCKLFTQLSVSDSNTQASQPVNLDVKKGLYSTSTRDISNLGARRALKSEANSKIVGASSINNIEDSSPTGFMKTVQGGFARPGSKKYLLVQTLLNNTNNLSLPVSNNWKNSIYGASKKPAFSGSGNVDSISIAPATLGPPNSVQVNLFGEAKRQSSMASSGENSVFENLKAGSQTHPWPRSGLRKPFLTYWLLPFISLLPFLDTTQAKNIQALERPYLSNKENQYVVLDNQNKVGPVKFNPSEEQASNQINGFVLISGQSAPHNNWSSKDNLEKLSSTYSGAYYPIRYYLNNLFSEMGTTTSLNSNVALSKEQKNSLNFWKTYNSKNAILTSNMASAVTNGSINPSSDGAQSGKLLNQFFASNAAYSLKAQFALSQVELQKSQLNFYWENPYIKQNSLQVKSVANLNSSFALKTESLEPTILRPLTEIDFSLQGRTQLLNSNTQGIAGPLTLETKKRVGPLHLPIFGEKNGIAPTGKGMFNKSVELKKSKGFKIGSQMLNLTPSQTQSSQASRFMQGIFIGAAGPYSSSDGTVNFLTEAPVTSSAENYKDLNIKLDHLIKQLNWAVISEDISKNNIKIGTLTNQSFRVLQKTNMKLFEPIMDQLTTLFSVNGAPASQGQNGVTENSKVKIVDAINLNAPKYKIIRNAFNLEPKADLSNGSPEELTAPIFDFFKTQLESNTNSLNSDASFLEKPIAKVVNRAFDSKLDSTFILLTSKSNNSSWNQQTNQNLSVEGNLGLGATNPLQISKFVKLRTPILSSSYFISNTSLSNGTLNLINGYEGASAFRDQTPFDYVPLSGTAAQGFVIKETKSDSRSYQQNWNLTSTSKLKSDLEKSSSGAGSPSYQNYLKFIKAQISLILNSWPNLKTSPKQISNKLLQNTVLVNNQKPLDIKTNPKGLFNDGRFALRNSKEAFMGLRLKAQSINLILNHKKFHFLGLRNELGSLTSNEGSYFYLPQRSWGEKKEIEKKRKAKKLRLESRRQKKRKRFYPRPNWLRLRLKMDLTKSRLWNASAPYKISSLKSLSFSGQNQFQKGNMTVDRWSLKKIKTAMSDQNVGVVTANNLGCTVSPSQKWINSINLTTYNNFLYNIASSLQGSELAGQADKQIVDSANKKYANNLESIRDLRNGTRNSKKFSSLRSKYKAENQKIAELSYSKKFDVISLKLTKIKNKSNYVNFEPKAANQTIPKKETNSSFYRDFWLWLYNTTTTNSYNKTILLDNFLTHISVPLTISSQGISSNNNFFLNSSYNQKALKMVPWATNKTNLWTTTNKRFNLWSSQKLRNQSKNNKTKWLQKQLQTKINTFLSPSIEGYSNQNQKIGFARPGSIAPELLLKIRKKIHQKDQKLSYLVNFSNGQTLATGVKNRNRTIFAPSLLAQQSFNSKASLNLAWWERFSLQNLLNNSDLSINPKGDLVDLFSTQNVVAPLEQDQVNKTMWFGLLFHFCALISLVSISQIRCFIKFHLILLHKLSNTYLSILYSISDSLYRNLKNLGFDFVQAQVKRRPTNKILKSKNLILERIRISKDSTNQAYNSQFASTSKQLSIRVLLENQDIIYSKNTKPSKSKPNAYIQNPAKFSSILKKYISRVSQKPIVGSVAGLTNMDKSSEKSQKPSSSSKIMTSREQLQYDSLLKQSFTILGLSKQIELIELARILNKNTKKTVLNSGFKVIDSFESCLRLIYGFFEKPAEFTMDWIAYAFLVEWSSDLLSFTPQKAETQNWLAFSKIIRQNQLGFILYNQSFNSNTAGIAMSVSSFVPAILLTQFISKRFLYLNDQFLSILYKPDSDLLNRQKKGTLFWDIWSDFLIKAADKYNINVPSLSNIKEEQNLLLENFLADSTTSTKPKQEIKSRLLGTIGLYSKKIGSPQLTLSVEQKNADNSGSLFSIKNYLQQKAKVNTNNSVSESFGIMQLSQPDGSLGAKTYAGSENLAQQFVTYQSKETELFLDYNSPKSFNNLSAIKYYSLIQQPIGTIVCQIYSGILTKQIAKNILVIGSTLSSNSSSSVNSSSASGLENNQKTLLIQALAGETEIKMITDNASRYAIVNRGFAVGIKYLKEVFDAITLNTPCLFLLEDIHLIGERRPQLISDHGDAGGSADGMNKSVDAAFGSQRSGEAVHEKNQIYYQLSRHAITHYKKPFKGDFSLAIPTNHFSFDLFLKSRPNNIVSLTHPLSYGINIFDLDNKTDKTDKASQTTNLSTKLISKRKINFGTSGALAQTNLSTSLLLKLVNNTLLAPPSTSPFSVLLLKEQKKLKAAKIVKEIPWVGLPTEQLSLLPRVSYSVRAKVGALAEFGFTNMSAKLDMITDLLVIIDSVRSHRGFVVFATTHLPHLLDPALRRPGRLDETISIPTIANLWTRWEFSKSSLASTNLNAIGTSTPFGSNSSYRPGANKLNNYITNSLTGYAGTYNLMDFFTLDFAGNVNNNFFSPIVHGFSKISQMRSNTSYQEILATSPGLPVKYWRNTKTASVITNKKSSHMSLNNQDTHFTTLNKFSKKYTTKVSHIAYYQMGKKLITNNYVFKLSNFTPIYLNPSTYDSTTSLTEINELILNYGPEALKYKSLYSSPRNMPNILIGLMSGKFSEVFAFKSFQIPSSLESKTSSLPYMWAKGPSGSVSNAQLKARMQQNFISLYGIDETWRAATSFALSFIQKRYLFNKNLIVPKLLHFLNYGALEEAPSPPSSNILIPAKRYENYKKTLKENIQFKMYGLTTSNLQNKLQNHMKQAFIKNIYAKETSGQQKIQEEFLKTANNSLLKLAGIDLNKNLFVQSTSASAYYENKIFNRHRLALNNQWWNSQLTEHSAETLFLSDIDWRYTFIDNSSLRHNTQELFIKLGSKPESLRMSEARDPLAKDSLLKSSNIGETRRDILIDFPDADQHYNPKQRRWTITSGYWNTWFNVDKNLQNEIFDSLILESVMSVYTLLNSNREVLDYAASKFMKKGLIKELEIKNFLVGGFSSDGLSDTNS